MNGIRSLGNKIALIFFLITAAAFGVIYFWVVTQPESSLEERRLSDLEAVAGAYSGYVERMRVSDPKQPTLERRVRALADATGSRVTLLEWKERPGRQLDRRGLDFYPRSDSGEQGVQGVRAGGARRAHRAHAERLRQLPGRGHRDRRPAGGTRKDPQWRGALLAQLRRGRRNRLLHPRARALGLRRRAARRADRGLVHRPAARAPGAARRARCGGRRAGHMGEPLPVDSEDELGQLTRTFNAMQQKLREVDIARKEFIATASHELRTPIFSLAGFVELLQDEDLDEETRREFVDTMREQVERLQKLSSTCSTCPGSTPARSSCTPSRSTWPS